MQLCHTSRATSAVFDDPNFVSSAGLVPVLALARSAGLYELSQQHLMVSTDRGGASPGFKVASLIAGMVAGADSIDDMALLRHGGMGRVVYIEPPSPQRCDASTQQDPGQPHTTGGLLRLTLDTACLVDA